jgi:hypothetical protein
MLPYIKQYGFLSLCAIIAAIILLFDAALAIDAVIGAPLVGKSVSAQQCVLFIMWVFNCAGWAIGAGAFHTYTVEGRYATKK